MSGLNVRDIPVSKGHLNPAASPPVTRYWPPDDLTDLVRHFWVPEWSLPDGRAVTASVLPYSALNLVVEPTGVTLNGPTTRRWLRTLAGRGWVVGALLRPAATLALGHEAPALVDQAQLLDEPELASRVAAAMAAGEPATMRHHAAIGVLSDWLRASLVRIGEAGALANAAVALVERDPAVHRVADLAAALHVTPHPAARGAQLHRLHSRRGHPPHPLAECRPPAHAPGPRAPRAGRSRRRLRRPRAHVAGLP